MHTPECMDEINKMLDSLGPDRAEVVRLAMGLHGGRAMRPDDISKVTKRRVDEVRALLGSAGSSMRHPSRRALWGRAYECLLKPSCTQ